MILKVRNRKLNFEIIKFGIYILFPIGTLYYFNNPKLMDSFHCSIDDMYAVQKRAEKQLFKNIPRTKEDIDEVSLNMKKSYMERKARDLEA